MNDIQTKLDKLSALRDTLVELASTVNLTDAFSIDYDTEYTGKIHSIAKKYQRQIKKNTLNFNNLSNENRILAKESQRLARESQRLAKENITDFNDKNTIIKQQSSNSIKILIDKIETDIKTLTTELAKATAMEELRNLCNTAEYLQQFTKTYLIGGPSTMTDNNLLIIERKIKSHCDWHYPGLQINPISINWINYMVGADPLYITCHHTATRFNDDMSIPIDEINDIINNYSLEYQRRIRIYNIKNQDFSALPSGQFGCIACCEFLNMFDIDIINQYIKTFFNLLRPGGTLICNLQFTQNTPIDLVDPNYFKYAVELILHRMFNDAGYIVNSLVELTDEPGNWVYTMLIEVSKPGVLATSKAHQVLGSVITK